MKNGRKITVLFTLVLVGVALFYWMLGGSLFSFGPEGHNVASTSTAPSTSAAAVLPSKGQGKTPINLLYLTPIAFYGRVVDQSGAPVSGARVDASANNVPFGDGQKFDTVSGSSGEFAITGKHGRSLFVKVSKQKGKAASLGTFAYGGDLGNGIHSPSKTKPVVFILRKAGILEPLIRRQNVRIPLSADGTMQAVSLRQSAGTDHKIVLSCTSEGMPAEGGTFNWSFKLQAENGLIVERTGRFDFEAPASGYEQSFSVNMTKALPLSEWKDQIEKSFFIVFEDNVSARVALEIHAGAEPVVWFESYMNPKAGSRNLEAGPPRKIQDR